MIDSLNLKITGELEISQVMDNQWKPVMHCKNAVQDVGSGTVAKCLTGAGSINTMYLLFSNGAIPSTLNTVATGNLTIGDVQTSSGTINYCRVPVIHVATESTTGRGENIVIFHGITTGTAYGSGAAFGSSSKLYGAALVCSTSNAAAGDLLFSVAKIDPTVTKAANAQLGIKWKVTVL